MVEKFNFYDIYGYLLPGLVLIGLVWLPFGLLFGMWPKAELGSAVLILVVAYITGHFMQTLAVPLLPSKKLDKYDNQRHPSDLMLDNSDNKFSGDLKKIISEAVTKFLGLALKFPEDLGARKSNLKKLKGEDYAKEENSIALVTKLRTDAFFQARSALLRTKGTSYWEQFEGLYALMRGVCFAFALAVAYLSGWSFGLAARACFGSLFPAIVWISGVAGICLMVLLLLSWPTSSAPPPSELPAWKRTVMVGAIVFASLAAGAIFASQAPEKDAGTKQSSTSFILIVVQSNDTKPDHKSLPLRAPASMNLLLALLAAVISVRCYGAYKTFADSFAENVWRDFANIQGKWAKPEESWSPQSQELLSPPSDES